MDRGEDERDRPPLFAWLEDLARAAASRDLERQAIGLALLAAIESRGTTGEGATASASQAAKLGLSERQMRRHLAVLVAKGWLTRTSRGTRGVAGRPGRLARYRLTRPSVTVSSEVTEEQATPGRVTVSSDLPNHMTYPDESDDTDHAQSCLGSPSQGPPTIHLPAPSTDRAPQAGAMDGVEIHDNDAHGCPQFEPATTGDSCVRCWANHDMHSPRTRSAS